MTSNENKTKIKDIKDVFYDELDEWPSEPLKKALFQLRPEEGAEVYLHLKEDYYDLTDKALEVEKKFRPEVTLRTRELKTELERWKIGGGAFFRVIGDQETVSKSQMLSLQYFILWTRQLFPFQFVFLSIPFFLATLFIWQFSATYPAGPDDSLIKYLTLLLTGLLFIMIGVWVVFEGLYKRYIKGFKNWKTVPDSMIGFVLPGLLFWTTGLEYAITEIAGSSGFVALIPVSAWLSLLLGVIVLFIGADAYLRGEKSYVERFSHPMDYAPLILFLKKDDAGIWQIDGAQFDYFHYKTMFIPKEKLVFKKDDEEKEHPWFIIDRSWHAFREFIKPNIMIRIMANTVFNIIIWILATGVYVLYALIRFNVVLSSFAIYLDHPLTFAIVYVLLPMIIILMIWSRSRTKEFELEMWEEMNKKEGKKLLKQHHLSFNRLRILWNLRNREHIGEQRFTNLWSKSTWIEGDSSRLVARVKLQYPFDMYQDWGTLRDTQEELLSLISIQTKDEELREIEEELEDAKDELQKQMIKDIHEIEDKIEEFFDEDAEDIEEERDEIMEKLEDMEENVQAGLVLSEIEDIVEDLDVPELPEEEKEEEIEEAVDSDMQEELGIPDVPKLDEIDIPDDKDKKEDKKEEIEFEIPDIPIDVEKEDD